MNLYFLSSVSGVYLVLLFINSEHRAGNFLDSFFKTLSYRRALNGKKGFAFNDKRKGSYTLEIYDRIRSYTLDNEYTLETSCFLTSTLHLVL